MKRNQSTGSRMVQSKLNFEPVPKKNNSMNKSIERKTKNIGMKNTGNSCYFNAIIQTLLHIPSFFSDFTNKRLNAANLGSGSFCQALLDTVNKSVSVMDPSNAQTALAKHCKQFANKKQQDAHELFGTCLNIIEKEFLPYLRGLKSLDDEISLPDKPLLLCPTKRNFSFIMKKEFVCSNCNDSSKLQEIFRDLSLEIKYGATITKKSVTDLFNNYFICEQLERNCEKCPCKKAIVSKKMYTLPRILVIHLKRFKHGSTVQKITEKITIDKIIQIDSKYLDPEFQEPIYFHKDKELSEYLKTRSISLDATIDDDDDEDLKKAMSDSLSDLPEDEQIQLAIQMSKKDYEDKRLPFPLNRTTMQLSTSDKVEDYGSDTEEIAEDDEIKLEYEKLELPSNTTKPAVTEESVLPLQEEIELLDNPPIDIDADKNHKTATYHLQAIVRHKGESVHSGHYITNILDERNEWYCFNDSIVSKIEREQSAISGETEKEAYILFYVHSSFFQKLVN